MGEWDIPGPPAHQSLEPPKPRLARKKRAAGKAEEAKSTRRQSLLPRAVLCVNAERMESFMVSEVRRMGGEAQRERRRRNGWGTFIGLSDIQGNDDDDDATWELQRHGSEAGIPARLHCNAE
ncbi:hypothetical protein MKZ38_001912 [Zalerion maritima]|uniref:Uncharacterized protein n=1 Tax=Zalerion maritima TaxID=339359 RepID=A0AAD5RR44_9PEZI|nr:hypothetical protein MKZ38_001912 [Zalerion maritima]